MSLLDLFEPPHIVPRRGDFVRNLMSGKVAAEPTEFQRAQDRSAKKRAARERKLRRTL